MYGNFCEMTDLPHDWAISDLIVLMKDAFNNNES